MKNELYFYKNLNNKCILCKSPENLTREHKLKNNLLKNIFGIKDKLTIQKINNENK